MGSVSKKKKLEHNFTRFFVVFFLSVDVAKTNFAWQLDGSHFTMNFGRTGGFVELGFTSLHSG